MLMFALGFFGFLGGFLTTSGLLDGSVIETAIGIVCILIGLYFVLMKRKA